MKNQIIIEVKQQIRLYGFSFTLADTASRLCISKKTIYKHFSNKEDIIKTIILEMKQESDIKQIELMNNPDISPLVKLKSILTMLPTDYDLITPITLNQLRRDFPDLNRLVRKIYHKDWDKFNGLYQECIDMGLLNPIDLEFFKELYIVSISYLPEVPSLSKYNHNELLHKIVEQLFAGIEVIK